MCFYPTGTNINTIFSQHYPKLVQLLPMEDPEFQKLLLDSELCSSDVMEDVNDRPMKAEKATYFLDEVIKPALKSGYNQTFTNLLQILKDTSKNDIHLENLLQDIETGIRKYIYKCFSNLL